MQGSRMFLDLKRIYVLRFEVFMEVKIRIVLFRVVTLCRLFDGAYQCFVESVITMFRIEMNQIWKE